MICKKFIFTGALIGAGLVAVNSFWAGSVGTAFHRAKTVVSRQISPEFELERIRGQIAKLTPDMHRNIEKIAEETVAVNSLNRKIETVQAELGKRKDEMLALSAQVESGVRKVSMSPERMKDKLTRDLKAYKACEHDLSNKQKLVECKKAAIESARAQLVEIQQQRQDLEVLAAQFETEIAQLRQAQTMSKFKVDFDNSRLADIKASFENLRNRIDTERNVIEITGQVTSGSLPSELTPEASTKDVVAEVKELFGKSETKSGAD